jgi:anti-sigma-K factor RskA
MRTARPTSIGRPRRRLVGAAALATVAAAAAAMASRRRRTTDLVDESEDYEAENEALFAADPPSDTGLGPNPEEHRD